MPPAAIAADPHAGVPGAPPLTGAAGMPGTGGMPGTSAIDPMVQQHLREARSAAEAKPGDYDALVQLGNWAYDAHEFAQAVDAYERALKVKPGDPNVMTDLGTAYKNEGQADKALELFRKARAADPTHWQSLYNEVLVLALDKRDAAGAKTALERLKAEHPGLPAVDALERQIAGSAAGK